MKKVLFLGLLFVVAVIGFSSCNDDDDNDFLRADVIVRVTDSLGVVQIGKTVYMYRDTPITDATVPGDARRMAVTDDNGIARFSLNFTELNIFESRTTLYFAVFYTLGGQMHVVGSRGVTVNRNESKEVEIKIPL